LRQEFKKAKELPDVAIHKYTQVKNTLRLIQQQFTMMRDPNVRDTSTSTSQVHPYYAEDCDDKPLS